MCRRREESQSACCWRLRTCSSARGHRHAKYEEDHSAFCAKSQMKASTDAILFLKLAAIGSGAEP